MGPTLDELIEQGKQIEAEGLFMGCEDFWQWHDSCLEFLQYVQLQFREEVASPLAAQRGVTWLQETFRNHDHDNHQ